MARKDVRAYCWECDYCGREKLLAYSDTEPPLDWVIDGELSFCCWGHANLWKKEYDELLN